MSEENPQTIREMLEPAIRKAGGWVNTHAHADRAFTLSPEVLEMRRRFTLQQKWDALDRLRQESTEEDFYRRFCTFFELMISQGCKACATFVDIDPLTQDRAIKAGFRARDHYADQITVKMVNQTLKGVIDPEARKWFDIGAKLVDIIGGLPKRDERDFGRGAEAFDVLLPRNWARWPTCMWTNSISRANTKPKCSRARPLSSVCRAASWQFTPSRWVRTPRCTAIDSTSS